MVAINPLAEKLGVAPKADDSIDAESMLANALGMESSSSFYDVTYNGDKFFGGFGDTKNLSKDFWTLRQRSSQLFEENLYARGMLRRHVTNVVNTGLNLEAKPDETILGVGRKYLETWSENVENRYVLYTKNKTLCDYSEQQTLGKIQAQAEFEALVNGDVLVIIKHSKVTGLPQVTLIKGAAVQTPLLKEGDLAKGHRIVDGVELDKKNRHVAYWVLQEDGEFKRFAAKGEKSGRRLAYLYYATEKRTGEVRGTPLLALIMQSLKEIDRYRDAVQRKAVVNSLLAMFMTKTTNNLSSSAFPGHAEKKRSADVMGSSGENRRIEIKESLPGVFMTDLQYGEKPEAFGNQGIDEKFSEFERAIVQAMAWANEMPPEILMLSFNSNYAASQGAVNEYKLYLNRKRNDVGMDFCQPIYVEFLISEHLNGKMNTPGFLESWRAQNKNYDLFSSWTNSDWTGAIKPASDLLKTVKAYQEMTSSLFMTNAKATRELSGQKFTKVAQQALEENRLKAEALRPMLELKKEYGEELVDQASDELVSALLQENEVS